MEAKKQALCGAHDTHCNIITRAIRETTQKKAKDECPFELDHTSICVESRPEIKASRGTSTLSI